MKRSPPVWVRVRRLEATMAPGPLLGYIVVQDKEGTLRNPEGVPVVPPDGTLVIVLTERRDGPQ